MFEGVKPAAVMAVCAALLSACLDERMAGGTGVGNPAKGSVTVALQAVAGADGLPGYAASRNPDGSFTITDAGGSTFTVRESFANVGRIRLQLPEGMDCKDADETACESLKVEIPGPLIANLMTGGWQPDPGGFRIPIGAYRRMEVRLESGSRPTGAAWSGLDGHSMVIKGEFEYAGRAGRPFSIALDFEEETRFDSDTGLSVDGREVSRLLILLDVERWLSGVDITGCLDTGKLALLPDGGLILDKGNSCGQLIGDIRSAVKASGRLDKRKD
jgi:hypothetical protein